MRPLRALAIARDDGRIVTPRGGGTSQCGQTVNDGIVIDFSKHLNRIISLDVENRTCVVEPGVVLDDLNRQLKPHGLWFPVDVSTASRATIGGMAGNNSCGGRSLRYGTMRDNTLSMDAALADGTLLHFGEVPRDISALHSGGTGRDLFRDMLALGEREAAEIADKFPKVQRRVGGYNLDALVPRNTPNNMAHLLVGSEGTLAFTTQVELKLWPVIRNKVLGVCHFGSFYEAMDAAQHLVKLRPIAVELVDRTMIALGRDIAMFRPIIETAVRGDPDAVLIVEFAEEDQSENIRRLKQLGELMGDLGFGWGNPQRKWGGVVEIVDPVLQTGIAEFRAAGLNVMMSMKQEGKPVSFVEDCAVPLPHLADYTQRLNDIFAKHGTRGTMYAHASEGCLHVRPVLNLKLEKDVKAMRAIAEETFAMVREYKGSHSGEHGDGIVRSEFHEAMFGARIVADFREIKHRFDPDNVLNPGKIVDPPEMDDRSLFRYPPDYRIGELKTVLDWSAYPGAGGGFQGAVEMCNNNGACRKLEGGVMCPSYRATRDEKDVTRGRANTLRLAISGQLGPGALASDDMMDTLKLCVSCKACRHECPTGVDMAKMKIEVLAARIAKHGLSLRDRLVAYLPYYAPLASRLAPLTNLRNNSAWLRNVLERFAGISAKRSLPAWRRDVFAPAGEVFGPEVGREVVLFADTFNRSYERENLDAALRVLVAGGYRVHLPRPADGSRPLCCGRTFLSVGLVDERPRRTRPAGRDLCAICCAGRAHHRPRAKLPADAARRTAFVAFRRRGKERERPCAAVRGISGARGRIRPAELAAQSHRRQGAGAWPLPSKIIWRLQASRAGPAAHSRSQRRDYRVQLLRHGRSIRVRHGYLRRFHTNGRAVIASGGTSRGSTDTDRRRRHLVPAPDRRWRQPQRTSCFARAGDEPRRCAIAPAFPPLCKGTTSWLTSPSIPPARFWIPRLPRASRRN